MGELTILRGQLLEYYPIIHQLLSILTLLDIWDNNGIMNHHGILMGYN